MDRVTTPPLRRPGRLPALPRSRASAALALAVLCASLCAASCAASREASRAAPVSRRAPVFTATCVVTIHDRPSERAFDEAFAALRGVDSAYSMWTPGSELDRLNAAAGSGPAPASPGLIALLERGLELARLTEGRYDPTVGPLVRLWGVGSGAARVPSRAEIEAALDLVGWEGVRVDRAAGRVELPRAGMALDFGSLAKGEGAVRAGMALAARGVRQAVVDVGGSVLVLGSRPDGKPWKVGIQRPGSPRGEMLGLVEVRDAVVNTSGIYERWFEAEGRRYHHVMDTATGQPLDNGLLSATVIRERSESADGPSLALLTLGAAEGIALADTLGLAAILVDAEKGVHLSRAARSLFSLTDPSYRLIP